MSLSRLLCSSWLSCPFCESRARPLPRPKAVQATNRPKSGGRRRYRAAMQHWHERAFAAFPNSNSAPLARPTQSYRNSGKASSNSPRWWRLASVDVRSLLTTFQRPLTVGQPVLSRRMRPKERARNEAWWERTDCIDLKEMPIEFQRKILRFSCVSPKSYQFCSAK